MSLYTVMNNNTTAQNSLKEATLSDVEVYLSEHNLVAVPKHGLERVFNTGYWTAEMQAIAERADQDLK